MARGAVERCQREPVWWHTVQVGPVFAAGPVSEWHVPQLDAKLEDVTEMWFAPVKGIGWLTPAPGEVDVDDRVAGERTAGLVRAM